MSICSERLRKHF